MSIILLHGEGQGNVKKHQKFFQQKQEHTKENRYMYIYSLDVIHLEEDRKPNKKYITDVKNKS